MHEGKQIRSVDNHPEDKLALTQMTNAGLRIESNEKRFRILTTVRCSCAPIRRPWQPACRDVRSITPRRHVKRFLPCAPHAPYAS